VKHTLGWSSYQVRSDRAMRRHWALVCCAFAFCWWAGGEETVAPDALVAPPQPPATDVPAWGGETSDPAPALPHRRPQLSWPVALRRVRAWLEPWVMLARYWRGWLAHPPPPSLQALLDWLGQSRPIALHNSL
jgi:hypothetical protein